MSNIIIVSKEKKAQDIRNAKRRRAARQGERTRNSGSRYEPDRDNVPTGTKFRS